MNALIRSLTLFVLALLSAHAVRMGDAGLTVYLLGVVVLACTRQGFARVVLLGVLAWAVFVWTDTTLDLVAIRQAMGQDWVRLAAILGGVTLLTLSAFFALLSEASKRVYSREPERARVGGSVFLLVSGLLWLTRAKAPFPILLLDRYLPGWGGAEILALALYGTIVVSAMLSNGGQARWRPRIWLLFSVVFFAQLLLGLAGLEAMLMTGSLHLPVPALIVAGPIYRGHSFFMPVLYVATLLLVGGAWCSHLCYIGAWDDRLSRARRFPANRKKVQLLLQIVILATVVAAAAGFRLAGVSTGSAVGVAAGFGLAGVAVMIVFSRRRGIMVHCTTWCPIGLISNLAGRLSPWRVRMGPGCSFCGRCSRACRYGALSTADLSRGRPGRTCTLCGDCVDVCREGVLGYRFPGLSPTSARSAFLVLVVSLHSVFLGVARI